VGPRPQVARHGLGGRRCLLRLFLARGYCPRVPKQRVPWVHGAVVYGRWHRLAGTRERRLWSGGNR
jgi:hypothetical protein